MPRARGTIAGSPASAANAKPPKRVRRPARGERRRSEGGARRSSAGRGVDDADAKKRAIIAALERARQKKEALAEQGAAPKNTEHVSAAVQAQIDAAEARRKRLAEQHAQRDGEAAAPRSTTTGTRVRAARQEPSMNATKRRAIYETLQSLNPHPTTELEYTTPFELLIAVMLSAQATDVSVNKAMRKMFPVANTPRQIVALGEEGVADYIKTIGLYRTKAKNVIATCHILLERYGGEVPADREALEACRASAARPPTSC
jgi:hypothetical protein